MLVKSASVAVCKRRELSTPPLPPPLADPEPSDTAPSSEPISDAGPPTVEPEVAEPAYVPPEQPPVTPALPLARKPPVAARALAAPCRRYASRIRPHLHRKQARGSREIRGSRRASCWR